MPCAPDCSRRLRTAPASPERANLCAIGRDDGDRRNLDATDELRLSPAMVRAEQGTTIMSILDKAIAAITPPESDEDRADARARAEAAAVPGDWLSQVLDHHRQIEAAFERVAQAHDAPARVAAQKALGKLLTGHAIAEEVSLYPALAAHHQVGHAELAYQEQSAAKMELGLLERLDPISEDYDDKLEHIRGAVLHHVYSEEGDWFLELKQSLPQDEQAEIGRRYAEEFARYTGSDQQDGVFFTAA